MPNIHMFLSIPYPSNQPASLPRVSKPATEKPAQTKTQARPGPTEEIVKLQSSRCIIQFDTEKTPVHRFLYDLLMNYFLFLGPQGEGRGGVVNEGLKGREWHVIETFPCKRLIVICTEDEMNAYEMLTKIVSTG
jgi:hypothetical protein